MGSKALFVLVLFLASVLLLSAEAPPKDVDQKFDPNNDDNLDTTGVEEMKQWRGRGPYRGGGPYGGRYGGGYCRYGCCRWGYRGGCRRCCYYLGEHLDIGADVEPHY